MVAFSNLQRNHVAQGVLSEEVAVGKLPQERQREDQEDTSEPSTCHISSLYLLHTLHLVMRADSHLRAASKGAERLTKIKCARFQRMGTVLESHLNLEPKAS